MITARGFGWRYAGRPVAALHDVDLDIREGEWVLVTGASGSGKSTLGLAIAGLVPHEFAGTWTGELRVAGQDVARTPRRLLAKAAGMLFQEPAAQLVMEHVDDDVAFGLENRAWPRAAMHQRVGEMLESLGIGHLRRRLTNGLSGGEQQRVALAGVLAPRPGVLVLDEPTSNLDALGTAAFYRALAGLRAMPHRPTVLLIEHRVDLAVPLVDTVLALDRGGGPLAVGPADRIFATHRDALAAEGIWLPGETARRVTAATEGARVAATPTGTGVPLLELRSVTYRYDRDTPAAVDDVSAQIADGERVALLGANGSGKSTLGRLAAGLLAPSNGVVRLGGTDPARLPASRLAERATFVFQDPAIQFVRDRVADELHAGLATPDQHAAADALLSELDLDRPGLREASPYTLSGGEQRRLSVATALVRDPALVVLDEPTYGQDRLRYEALVTLLRRRLTDGGTLLAATHDVVFAAEMTSRALVLDGGRLVTDGPVGAVVAGSKELDVSSPRPPAGLGR